MRLLLALPLLLALGLGCTPAQSATSAQDQAIAGDVVSLVNDAWKLAAAACEAPGVTVSCGPALKTAYTAIDLASKGVDIWGASGKGDYQCGVLMAAKGIQEVFAILNVPTLPPIVEKALTLASLVGSCPLDGGL